MNTIPSQPLAKNVMHTNESRLDLSSIPPVSILSAHFEDDEIDDIKTTLRRCGATLTTDVSDAKLFIGKVGTTRRAEFELRSRKFKVEAAPEPSHDSRPDSNEEPPNKKRKLSSSGSSRAPIVMDNDSGSTIEGGQIAPPSVPGYRSPSTASPPNENLSTSYSKEPSIHDDLVWVLKVDWLDACLAAGHLVALGEHVVYRGRVIERPPPRLVHKSIKAVFAEVGKSASGADPVIQQQSNPSIIERAKADPVVADLSQNSHQRQRAAQLQSRRFEGSSFASGNRNPTFTSQKAHLLQQTTSEYEGEDSDIPPPPNWVKERIQYSCQRFTPADGPNEDFLSQVEQIQMARILTDDETGTRAYSTIIASIAAYPFKLSHPREIAQLPGCDEKAVSLFVEWKNTGRIQAVEDYESDEDMKILHMFFGIWGVGAKTARRYYYNNFWRELDDIVEHGWDELDRVQQIGVKYYDDFLQKIPRAEVEQIAGIIRRYAVRLRDNRITVTIVGGYRRGKSESGDVDVIISHPDLGATAGLVKDLVELLEDDLWITHRLTLSLKNTQRGQTTLPFCTNKTSAATKI
ncbi:unnamed protein product [Periconia digitata]|uniref:DNA polymerase n=1 Tax=Periconia digitata TaxID=1303443 RepID=A0A9W4UIR0_9PLEO|nr:unnamed protein product [Periconia digitata]